MFLGRTGRRDLILIKTVVEFSVVAHTYLQSQLQRLRQEGYKFWSIWAR